MSAPRGVQEIHRHVASHRQEGIRLHALWDLTHCRLSFVAFEFDATILA
jgi:hypothetical protein